MFSINTKIISNIQVITEEYNIYFVTIGPQLSISVSSSISNIFYMNNVANHIFITLYYNCRNEKCYITHENNSVS